MPEKTRSDKTTSWRVHPQVEEKRELQQTNRRSTKGCCNPVPFLSGDKEELRGKNRPIVASECHRSGLVVGGTC